MGDIVSLWSESGRNIIGDDSTSTLELQNTSTGAALNVIVPTSNSTIAPIRLTVSGASAAFFDFRGAVISTASLGVTGANVAGLVRVWYQGVAGNAAGWMPIYLDAIAK